MNKYIEASIAYANFYFDNQKIFKRNEIKRILVIRLDNIGDMICTIPFIRGLRRKYNTAHITLVCSPLTYNLMEKCPYINDILIYDVNKFKKHRFMNNLRYIKNEWNKGNNCYDMAVVPYYGGANSYVSAWLAFYSKAYVRIGYCEERFKNRRKNFGARDIYFTNLMSPKDGIHEIEECLNVLKNIDNSLNLDDRLELWTDSEDKAVAEKILEEKGVSDKDFLIFVNLLTSDPVKDWPVEKYIETCIRIKKIQNNVKFILLGKGSAATQAGNAFIKEIPDAINIIGKTTLRQSIEIIKKCKLYFGGDTGTLHIATVFKLNGVAIYSEPQNVNYQYKIIDRFYPWQSQIKVVRPLKAIPGCEEGCHIPHHCVGQITVDEVYTKLREVMKIAYSEM